MPQEFKPIALMDRVGGLAGYVLLLEDAHMYELVLVAMQGEAQAAKEAKLEAEAKARANRARTKPSGR